MLDKFSSHIFTLDQTSARGQYDKHSPQMLRSLAHPTKHFNELNILFIATRLESS